MVPGPPTADESEIIRRCLAGDERAHRELMRRYERPVFSVAMRMLRQREDAEDVTQETFVRMFRALDRYDPSRPFAAWLFTITSRLCIDLLRRRRIRPLPLVRQEMGSSEEETIDVPDASPGPDTVTQHREEERRVVEMIEALPPHYRIVVMMRHQQDMAYEEIAAALELPLNTVRSRLHRARMDLKEELGRFLP